MTETVGRWSRRSIIALMVPLSCVVGNVAPYVVALIGIGLFLMLIFQRRLVAMWRQPLAGLFLVAFLILAACFAITAQSPRDALSAFNFIALLLAGAFLWPMQSGAGPNNTARFAWLALLGTAIALVLVSLSLAWGDTRGALPALGVIRISNAAILLGFLALLGFFSVEGSRRWLFLLGPPMGVAVSALTQSRGPLVAAALLTPVALVFMLRRLPRRAVVAVLAGVVLLLAVGIVVFGQDSRLAALPDIARAIVSGETVPDETTRIRLTLYAAGLEAFLQSPWIGHGWHNMMDAIVPFLAADQQIYATELPQLHNDVVDFAVAAGVIGLAVYLLLLAAPIVAAVRSPRDSQYELRIFGAALLVVSYIGAGLTDLMFGFEFHTMLYVTLATILIGYCRDAPVSSR